MEKKVKVNKMYGEWFYTKEVDSEDSSNYVYYFNGTDANGRKWNGMVCRYPTIVEFIKMNDIDKQSMVKSGQV